MPSSPRRLGRTARALRAALLAVVVPLRIAVPALAATQQEVEESLTCQCGCGLTVHACNHLQCPSGEPMKKEIAERLARGEDGETILAAFRTHYGEKVLSSPTLRGFDWLAWVTPVSRRPGGRARRHARHPPLPAVGSRDNAGKFA